MSAREHDIARRADVGYCLRWPQPGTMQPMAVLNLWADRTIAWRQPEAPMALTPVRVFIGPDPLGAGFQVAVAQLAAGHAAPRTQDLRRLFASRKGRSTTPLLVAVTGDADGETAWLLGPDERDEIQELPLEQAGRLLQAILDEPTPQAAYNRWTGLRHSASATAAAGFTNSGLFATHHLKQNAPQRPDWAAASTRAEPLLALRGLQLIQGLGFRHSATAGGALVLSADTFGAIASTGRAVAILLDSSEHFDATSPRYQLTPVAFGLSLAANLEVPWLVVLRGDVIRLYPGKDGVGVGQQGQTDTYFEVDLVALDADHQAFLPLVFSAAALEADGTCQQLLDDSARYATALGSRLRDRIYEGVVPALGVEVAHLLKDNGLPLDSAGLARAYEATLHILFRLLFQAYAEDRALLPAGRNEAFDAHSLKTLAARIRDTEHFDATSTALWDGLTQVWSAISDGNDAWQVPAYNGGLFATDVAVSPEGALIAHIQINDAVLGPALQALLIDVSDDGARGPVDFRSLSVREFGTIYEGLLESSLSIATGDLTVDAGGAWVPAKRGDTVLVEAGSVYFHSASGERKATGSYFTPKIVVDHLIERSITPVLTKHLSEVEALLIAGQRAEAAAKFWDFRVADLAMGSGHFLVAAVDKIEALMRNFLTVHKLPSVHDELLRLAAVAKDALGADDVAKSEIDEVSLLRRQVARRCIYGLDINPLAVELARLALWIHTFVPGLPMSSLTHGLVCANSLTGIGTIDEAIDAFANVSETTLKADNSPVAFQQAQEPPVETIAYEEVDLFGAVPGQPKLAITPKKTKPNVGYKAAIRSVVTDYLRRVTPVLVDVANAAEATKAEVQAANLRLAEAKALAAPVVRIFDAAVAIRTGRWTTHITTESTLHRLAEATEPSELVASLSPAHFPALFPEVFLRENPGFDVLLGNPPWEELQVEEHKFWLRVRPGLIGLKPAEQKREIERLRRDRADLLPQLQRDIDDVASMRQVLLTGPYPGLGTGDIDLYSAFAWRVWHLARPGGAFGIVLPRSQFNAAGGELWRTEVLQRADVSLVTAINDKRWIFDMEPRYAVAFVSATACHSNEGTLTLAGPFFSQAEFLAGKDCGGQIDFATLAKASTTAAIPNLPDAKSVAVFRQLRRAPRLDERRPGWDFRPVTEFHATNDRKTFDTGRVPSVEPVETTELIPVLGGAGFNLWQPETGEVYAWADPSVVEQALFVKRKRQVRLARSAFYDLPDAAVSDLSTLPFHHPRIAFRDVARSTDSRTCIAALIAPRTILTNKAPYLLKRSGEARNEAFLLGVLSSIPLDWYVRRYVEISFNLHIFNGLPVPTYRLGSPLCDRVVEIAGRLAAVDDRFAGWAAEVGVPVGTGRVVSTNSTTQYDSTGARSTGPGEPDPDLLAELDALVALLYGLDADQLSHIFATFHRGWDYEPRLNAVLNHYRAWKART